MKDLCIIPAIDIQDGQCVRLRRGRADEKTVYSTDPLAVALDWQARGATWLHVVDLDGAFEGCPVHDAVIRRILAKLVIPVQTGGGLRTPEAVARRIEDGAARVILGTRAVNAPEMLAALVKRHAGRVAVGIDARGGFVQVKGWRETTSLTAVDLARQLAAGGVSTLIYTDTETDGMLSGPNTEALAALCDAVPECKIIASGGVAAVEHVHALRSLDKDNLAGVIVGKALYDGVADFNALCREAAGERIFGMQPPAVCLLHESNSASATAGPTD